jgi:hypothetical protein
MKLYRTVMNCADAGTIYAWFTSKREAWRYGNAFARDDGDAAGLESWNVEAVEITPTRKGIVAWLDKNFTSDNG